VLPTEAVPAKPQTALAGMPPPVNQSMVLNYQTVGLLKILIELLNSYLVSPINCWIIKHLAAPGNIADIINLLKYQPHILLSRCWHISCSSVY
jgi:hypothetical protein